MAISKAQQKAVKKYNDSHYDRVVVNLPKGERAALKAEAAARNISVNKLINDAIKEYLNKGSSSAN